MEPLKKDRTAAARRVTLLRIEITALTLDPDKEDEVREGLVQYRTEFNNYRLAHQALCEVIEDEQQLAHEEGLYTPHEQKTVAFVGQIQRWLADKEKERKYSPSDAQRTTVGENVPTTPTTSVEASQSTVSHSQPSTATDVLSIQPPVTAAYAFAAASTTTTTTPAPREDPFSTMAETCNSQLNQDSDHWQGYNPYSAYASYGQWNRFQSQFVSEPSHVSNPYNPMHDPILMALSLPMPNVEPFEGDIDQYRIFVNEFESRIG
jgi:hypothetical protein